MKTWKHGIFGIIVIITLAFVIFTCKDDTPEHTHTYSATWSYDATQHWRECTANDGAKTDVGNHTGNPCTVCGYETPAVPNPATITQGPPNGLAFEGKVTISTSDLYTAAEWDAVVANVITAINSAYEAASNAGKSQFRTAFGNTADVYGNGGNGVEIILVNNLAHNGEVRDGEFRTLYLKTSFIATADYGVAVRYMNIGVAYIYDYWQSDATHHWHQCSSCGLKDYAPHDWQWYRTATTEVDGLIRELCSVCQAASGNTRPD